MATWLRVHRNAFEFFGGVPERVVPDNLKAAIVRACWDEPEAQQAYRECAEHYGFLISPCRPRTPQHKGKVEQGGVHYVKRNFCGGREPTPLPQLNQKVIEWCLTTAGGRIHGTTKERPLERFATEKPLLRPLPDTPAAPIPAHGATGRSLNTTLGWSGGDRDGDAVAYDVYFQQFQL